MEIKNDFISTIQESATQNPDPNAGIGHGCPGQLCPTQYYVLLNNEGTEMTF